MTEALRLLVVLATAAPCSPASEWAEGPEAQLHQLPPFDFHPLSESATAIPIKYLPTISDVRVEKQFRFSHPVLPVLSFLFLPTGPVAAVGVQILNLE